MILLTIFENDHPRNISVKSFRNLTSHFREVFLRISLHPYSASSPHSPGPCLLADKNFTTIFEKAYSRNNSMKLFQNLTSCFREDFLRISSCPYSASSLHSPKLCLLKDQTFANSFCKRSPKEHPYEIIPKPDQAFQRRRFF